MLRSRRGLCAAIACWLPCAAARAGPNVPWEAPSWVVVRDAIASGRIADPLGGVQMLGGEQLQRLLVESGSAAVPGLPPLALDGPWARPLDRASLRGSLADERARPYSLPVRPRDLAGGISLSCEHQQGRPCGTGAGAWLELDSSAGWSTWLSATTRVRAQAGSDGYQPDLVLDRAYLKAQLGPVVLQLGRDVLALGPSVRSALMVSDHGVPADGARLLLQSVRLPFAPDVRLSALYFLERLRAPQTYPGTLLDCARMQLDFFDRVQLGGSRLLQLGGEGGPPVGGLKGFILEHFSRQGGDLGISNNRLSFDLSVRLPWLWASRAYYELAFEDTTRHFFNSLRFDADHLLGLEIRGLGLGVWRRLFVELEQTGRTSQEHGQFLTGMTSSARTIGTPLGPDGRSLWIRADLELPSVRLSPWFEWLRYTSDTYDSNDETGLFVSSRGVAENRQRLGIDAALAIGPAWDLTASLFAERVGNAGFVAGESRFNVGMRAAVTYTPAF